MSLYNLIGIQQNNNIRGMENVGKICQYEFRCAYIKCCSSVSSSLSALSAVVWKDILEIHFSHLHERRQALIAQTLGKTLAVL